MPYDPRLPLNRNINALIKEHDGYFVARCLEISVITDGPTLDETLANLREAIELHLENEDPAEFGLVPNPGLQITFQTELASAQT